MMATAIRVLFVDDEPGMLDIGKLFLERSGDFTVTTATSAPDAIRLLEQEGFDTIVSDYQMPEMNGIEFLVLVRTRFGQIPFILFTGKGREDVVIQAINSGADFYLQKGGESGAQFAELSHKIKQAASRKMAEEALKTSQIQLAEAMDLAHLVNWEFDVATGIFTFDDRFYALYGTTTELEGGNQMPADVYAKKFVHPDDQYVVADEVNKAIQATDPGYVSQVEHRIIRRDGEIRHIVVRFGILKDENGRTIKTHGANQDITERKQSEEALWESERQMNILLQNLPGMVYHCRNDPNWTMEFVSEGSLSLTGYTPEQFVTGKVTFDSIMHPEDVLPIWHQVQEALIKKRPYRLTYRIRTAQGGEKYVWAQGRGIYAEDGSVLALEGFITDITDRILVEEELRQTLDQLTQNERNLRESEERFRSLVESSLVGIGISKGNQIVFANAALLEMFGYTNFEEMAIKPLLDHLTPQSRMVVQERMEKLSRHEPVPPVYEHDIIRKDGSIRTLQLVVSTVTMSGENYRQSVFLDITERKAAEEALLESEARFRELFNKMSNGAAVYQAADNGADFVFVDFNPAAEKIDKIRKDEVIGRRVSTVFPGIREFGLLDVFSRVWRTGQPENHPVSIYKDARIMGWRENFVYKLPSGEIVSVYDDVTERKRAEEALQEREETFKALAENANDGILVAVAEGATTYANRRAGEITGYSVAELLKTSIKDLANPDEVKILIERFKKRLSGEDVSHQYETLIIRKDGKSVLIELTAAKTFWHGQPADLVIFRDITERKQMEEALRKERDFAHSVVGTAQAIVLILDPEGHIVYLNTWKGSEHRVPFHFDE